VRRVGGLASTEETSTISFANPGTSSFGQLYLQGPYYELTSNVNVLGRIETGGGSSFEVSSATPRTLTSRGADVRTLRFSNVRWVLLDGDAILALDNVEFTNMDPTVDQFTISRTGDDLGGESSGYTLWYWYFGTTPTTGKYINANDSNGAVPFVQLSMYYPNPGVHGGKVSTSGGAVINNWISAFIWTGLGSTNLCGNSGNWTGGLVPSTNDDITIPAGTPQNPRISSGNTAYSRNVTIAAGVAIALEGTWNVYGSLVGPLTNQATVCGGGALNLNGYTATRTVRGHYCSVWVWGDYKVDGQLITEAEVGVRGGNLELNGGRVDVGGLNGASATGTFYTTLGGTLSMTNAADLLIVGGSGVLLNGGSTSGRLTAGVIKVIGGQFNATTGDPAAFAPGGSHKVSVTGTTTLNLASGRAFNDLELGVGSTTSLDTDVSVLGTFSRSASGTGTTTVTASSNRTLMAGGLLFTNAQTTTFTKVVVHFTNGTSNATFDKASFAGFADAGGNALLIVDRSSGSYTFNNVDFGGAGFVPTSGNTFVKNLGAGNLTIANTTAAPVNGILNTHYVKVGTGSVTWGTPP
jgi:hypothetical protein